MSTRVVARGPTSADVGLALERAGQCRPRGAAFPPGVTGRFIEIEQRPLLGRAIGVKLAFAFDDALQTAESLQVSLVRIVDVDDVGIGDFRQHGDFTAMVGAHFDDCVGVIGGQFE